MLEKLKEYIAKHNLISSNDRLLLAISGGIDSMVMLDLFQKLPYYFEVAHMNFGLRGEESQGDQFFLQEHCTRHQLKLHIKKVDTQSYAESNKLSIQMSARNLRYEWFKELKSEFNLNHTLTAHHTDDSIETVFINIIRGTGLKGLKGIVSNEIALRPMLAFNRNDIQKYAEQNNIHWREDSSNSKTEYLRNKLRHTILPIIDDVNEHWRDNMVQLMGDMKNVDDILQEYYEHNISKIYNDGKIDITKRESMNRFDWLFVQLLERIGFTAATSRDILDAIDIPTGKEFESSSHRLVKGRGCFEIIVKKIKNDSVQPILIYENESVLKLNDVCYSIEKVSQKVSQTSYLEGNAYLDYNKLAFPLLIRKWQNGDWFVPYGMKGKKKLSDFFIDEKYTINEKENTFVVVSGEDIVCILGRRSDNRYRITENTQNIYQITRKHG